MKKKKGEKKKLSKEPIMSKNPNQEIEKWISGTPPIKGSLEKHIGNNFSFKLGKQIDIFKQFKGEG